MSPLISGITLTLFTILLCCGEFLLYPYVKKATGSYTFWLIIGLFLLIWFIGFKWSYNLIYLFKVENKEILPPYMDFSACTPESYFKSQIFLTDFCPFFYVATCICLIAQPSRKLAAGLAPILFLSCIVTFVGSIMLGDGDYTSSNLHQAEWSLKYIFVGTDNQRLKFFVHFSGLLVSVGVMANTPTLRWKNLIITFASAIIFIIYAAIIGYSCNITIYTGGVRPDDWGPNGDYGIISKIFKGVSFPGILFILLPFAALIIFLIAFVKFIVQTKTKLWSVNDQKSNLSVFKTYYNLNYYTYKDFWLNIKTRKNPVSVETED